MVPNGAQNQGASFEHRAIFKREFPIGARGGDGKRPGFTLLSLAGTEMLSSHVSGSTFWRGETCGCQLLFG